MKKKYIILLMLVLMVMMATTACGHKHRWSGWKVEKEATCTENGVNARSCSKCGEKETKDIPALGHNYVNGVCTICNEKE